LDSLLLRHHHHHHLLHLHLLLLLLLPPSSPLVYMMANEDLELLSHTMILFSHVVERDRHLDALPPARRLAPGSSTYQQQEFETVFGFITIQLLARSGSGAGTVMKASHFPAHSPLLFAKKAFNTPTAIMCSNATQQH
jgi:hypothetical protein